MASLGLMFCPATRSPILRQLSNSRLQFNTQCPERFATKIPADMVLIKHIHTAASDTMTQHIIPASSVECASMLRQGLNYQFRINDHLAINMSKATWPSPTPITIQSQQHELHYTGKDNCTWSPNRNSRTRQLPQIHPAISWNVHEVGRQWRSPMPLHTCQTYRPLQGMSMLNKALRYILEITGTPQPMPIGRAQIHEH